MTVYLLDINVLIALTDSQHVHAEAAHRWFASREGREWATCPITENGFVRIISHESYPNSTGSVLAAIEVLRELTAGRGHVFWHDDVSIGDVVSPDTVMGSAAVTDAYLIGLAARHGGKLATFDRRVSALRVPGGSDAFEVITP